MVIIAGDKCSCDITFVIIGVHWYLSPVWSLLLVTSVLADITCVIDIHLVFVSIVVIDISVRAIANHIQIL